MRRLASGGTALFAAVVASLVPHILHAQFTIEGTYQVTLSNPLGNRTELSSVIASFLPRLIGFATPIAAIMIIIGALYMLFSGGDPTRFATGKKVILYTAIGYAIIFIASSIPLLLGDILS